MISPPRLFTVDTLYLSNIRNGRYRYTQDLLALEQTGHSGTAVVPVGHHSPLRCSAWEEGLSRFPDRQFAKFLLRGIRHGFRIGMQASHRCRPSSRNANLWLQLAWPADWAGVPIAPKEFGTNLAGSGPLGASVYGLLIKGQQKTPSS